MVRAKAKVYVLQGMERTQHEAGSNQQSETHGHLANQQQAAQTALSAIGATAMTPAL